jgi:hypothetical protein
MFELRTISTSGLSGALSALEKETTVRPMTLGEMTLAEKVQGYFEQLRLPVFRYLLRKAEAAERVLHSEPDPPADEAHSSTAAGRYADTRRIRPEPGDLPVDCGLWGHILLPSTARTDHGAIRSKRRSRRISVWNNTALIWARKVRNKRYARMVCVSRNEA